MAQTQTTSPCQADTPAIVLGVAAHPDDLDAMAAGSIAAWTAKGARAYYLILTNGDKGSADLDAEPAALAQLRRQEQRQAASLLGVEDVFFCDYADGELSVTMDVKRDIARIIRKVQPDTVITNDPTMIYDVERGCINHPDHRAAGQATLDAVYPLARDRLSFPELASQQNLQPHIVSTVLLTNLSAHNCFVDVTDTFDTKLAALAEHGSQFSDMPALNARFLDLAESIGRSAGVKYAEGFLRINVQATF